MRILLVDDHPLFRKGLHLTLKSLQSGITTLEASNLPDAFSLVRRNPDLDLALVDLRMPGIEAINAVIRFRRTFPAVRIAVLSSSENPNEMRACLDAGAAGDVNKSADGACLLGAIREMLEGKVHAPPEFIRREQIGTAEHLPPSVESLFTERQCEMLALLVEGCPNKIIADRMALTTSAIKAHLANIFALLRVTNRTQAVLAIQRSYFRRAVVQ